MISRCLCFHFRTHAFNGFYTFQFGLYVFVFEWIRAARMVWCSIQRIKFKCFKISYLLPRVLYMFTVGLPSTHLSLPTTDYLICRKYIIWSSVLLAFATLSLCGSYAVCLKWINPKTDWNIKALNKITSLF